MTDTTSLSERVEGMLDEANKARHAAESRANDMENVLFEVLDSVYNVSEIFDILDWDKCGVSRKFIIDWYQRRKQEKRAMERRKTLIKKLEKNPLTDDELAQLGIIEKNHETN